MKWTIFVLLLVGGFAVFTGCKKKEAKAEETPPSIDRGWPRQIDLDKVSVILHQPQIDEWKDYLRLTASIAFEVISKDDPQTRYVGAAQVSADTETDFDKRQVLIYNKKVISAKLQGADPAVAAPIEQQLMALAANPEVISLDRILPMVSDNTAGLTQTQISVEPPAIFYSSSAAVLVILDGEPFWNPVADGSSLQYAVNTNWDLFLDKNTSTYYLLNDEQWLTTNQLKGTWTTTGSLPQSFSQLPKDENWADVQARIPAKSGGEAPKVFVSNVPAELITVEGAPQFEAIPGTQLLAVKNTDCDLYLYSPASQYYFLVSGRWFRAASLDGPWTFATPDLPEDFSKIPEESEQGHVLATVPGTPQAKEAAVQAEIPQTAEVSRDAKPPDVKYEGEPQFKEIEGTSMSYAQNTPSDVIKVENNYYYCNQGAWFVSPYPTTGWVVCTSVPPVIYTIPPAYPVYHVTYVRAYGYSASHVTFGYTAGYMGVHVSFGVPMYGTGYYYPPYYYPGYRPVYYPYPYSYGCRAYYNPYTGFYGHSARVYGPYGGAGYGAAYNPYTGTYARGRSVYGPYGAAGEAVAYNPRTGTHAYAQTVQTGWSGSTRARAYNERTGTAAATRQGHNPYAQWGESVVSTRNGNWAHTAHYTDANGTRRAFETSGGAKGATYRGNQGTASVIKNSEGDLYVGKDGNVYKKENNGGWSQAGRGSGAQQNRVAPTASDAPATRQTPTGREGGTTDRSAGQASRDRSAAQQPQPSTRQSPATQRETPAAKPSQPSRESGATAGTAQQPARDRSTAQQPQPSARQTPAPQRETPAAKPSAPTQQPAQTQRNVPSQTSSPSTSSRPSQPSASIQPSQRTSPSSTGTSNYNDQLNQQQQARQRGDVRSTNTQNYQQSGAGSAGRMGGRRRN